ncbi:MAG: helix-turn-helix domain-containing protein [Butyricicoccus sp.]
MKAEFRDYYEVLGLNIAYYRRYAHYSQTELAGKVGIEQPHLSKIENASVGISIDLLFRIADALEVEPYLLLKVRN